MQDGELIETNYDDIIELPTEKRTREIQEKSVRRYRDLFKGDRNYGSEEPAKRARTGFD